MDIAKSFPQPATREIAEKILTQTFGGSVHLVEKELFDGSARSQVQRYQVLSGPATAPSNVIVKRVNHAEFDPDTVAAWWFFNDWAGLQFTQSISESEILVPAVYGGDRNTGLFVMEDLGDAIRLDYLLLGEDPDKAEAGLLSYATLHGRLHAMSIGRQATYLQVREALGRSDAPTPYYQYDWLLPTLQGITKQLGLTLPQEIEIEMGELKNQLLEPGPFLSFIQSDAAPDNILCVDGRWRMLDFEGCRYSHALLEGAYLRMPFPTCWCVYRLPETIIHRAETAYRNALIKGCPEAADDQLFYPALVGACIFWSLNFFTMLRPLEKMLENDRSLVALTDRQRCLLYLNTARDTCEEFGYMRTTGKALGAVAIQLAKLWPEARWQEYYPAFRGV